MPERFHRTGDRTILINSIFCCGPRCLVIRKRLLETEEQSGLVRRLGDFCLKRLIIKEILPPISFLLATLHHPVSLSLSFLFFLFFLPFSLYLSFCLWLTACRFDLLRCSCPEFGSDRLNDFARISRQALRFDRDRTIIIQLIRKTRAIFTKMGVRARKGC